MKYLLIITKILYLSIFIIILSIILILMMPINTIYELNNYSATF